MKEKIKNVTIKYSENLKGVCMSASAIGWIISIVFVVVLIGGFFIGFWRGLKRSIVNLVISLIGIIISFFVTPFITKTILNISISVNGQTSSINNVLVDSLKNNEEIASLIENNPNLDTFFSSLPAALANVLIFIVFALVVELVCYIIFKILALTCFKYKPGAKKLRLFGGGVGLIKTFIFSIFIFMPFASLIGTLDYISQDKSYFVLAQEGKDGSAQNPEHLIDSVLPSSLKPVISGLENNLLIKICGASNLDDAMFDYLTKVEVDGENVRVREEIKNGYVIADYSYQLKNYYDANGLVNFKNTNFKIIEKSVNNFAEGGLFEKIISSTLANVIENYKDYSFINNIEGLDKIEPVLNDIADNLREMDDNSQIYQYFSSDIKEMFNIFKSLSTSGVLDQVASAQEENIIEILVKEENKTTFTQAIESVFNLNIIQDSAVSIVNLALDSVSEGLEEVGVDTTNWTEQDWSDVSNSLVNIIENYSDLSKEGDIFEVMSAPTILVEKESEIDIESFTSKLGTLIDEAREIKLLQTAQGTSILDKFLSDQNIALPSQMLIDKDGNEVTINSYTKLFKFISEPLNAIKANDIYATLTSTLSANEIVKDIAIKVSKNQTLLEDIILPLYQVEFTKDIIIDHLTGVVNSEVMDLNTLLTYNDWKYELPYISQILVNLNSLTNGEDKSYLELALDGEIGAIIDSLSEEEVDKVLKPVLYASTTAILKQNIANEIEEVINGLTPNAQTTIDFASATLKSGDNEDQAEEICEVFKGFIGINNVYQSGMKISEIDKVVLSEFMNILQKNAYRVELQGKSEEGIFKGAFINLTNAIKEAYSSQIEASSELKELFSDPSNYIKINFSYVFSLLNNELQG